MKKIDKAIEAITQAIIEERTDFLEASDNCELTPFQQGVIYGLKLARVKVKGVKEND